MKRLKWAFYCFLSVCFKISIFLKLVYFFIFYFLYFIFFCIFYFIFLFHQKQLFKYSNFKMKIRIKQNNFWTLSFLSDLRLLQTWFFSFSWFYLLRSHSASFTCCLEITTSWQPESLVSNQTHRYFQFFLNPETRLWFRITCVEVYFLQLWLFW